MTAPEQESLSSRTQGYPVIPEETWWRLRKQFKAKGAPKPWNEEYLVTIGVRANIASAKNLVRPFKRIGLFMDDGKATDRYWDWTDDAKYADVCRQILHEVYPETLTHLFTSTEDTERERLVAWFQRNLDVQPQFARQYAAFYLLLLEADPTKQDEANSGRQPRSTKPGSARTTGSNSRSGSAKARTASANNTDRETPPRDNQQDQSSETHRPARAAGPRGFEPSLNINIQIHIPADASPEQIDQIFQSMGKHLYSRQDEAGE